MLSAETAASSFPIESVEMMDRIVRQTEFHLWKSGVYDSASRSIDNSSNTIWDIIADATSSMSKMLNAHAVLMISKSGMSAATISSARPATPILAITARPEAGRTIALLWGVIPVLDAETGSINPNELARRVAMEKGLVEAGENVLLVRGFHSDPNMNTPSITIINI